MAEITCSRCGANRKVFYNIEQKGNVYQLNPLCLECKKKELEISEVVRWNKKLRTIENQISNYLVEDCFPQIKFKKNAQQKIANLMRKYPIRKVFEVCLLSDNKFNLHVLENKCKQN